MKFEILNIEDTEDGGAVVTIEVDREMLHMAFEQFLNQAIMEKVNQTFIEAATRGIFEEDGLPPESDTAEEEIIEAFRNWDNGDLARSEIGTDANTDWSGSFTYPHER